VDGSVLGIVLDGVLARREGLLALGPAADVRHLGMVDKVLEELVVVLGEDHEPGRLDDVADVIDELAAVGRQLLELEMGRKRSGGIISG
jgi:hypothetical protein